MAYSKSRHSYLKELYCILCIAAVLFVVLVSLVGPGGYFALVKARDENERKSERIDGLMRSNQERTKTIEALRSDRNALEKEARKKGYARKDEIVQQLPDEPKK